MYHGVQGLVAKRVCNISFGQIVRGNLDSSFQIPLNKLTVSYCRSSGPGGQNVNKVNTKAEVRFNIAKADWLSPEAKINIPNKFPQNVNKAGELYISSEISREQHQNLKDCINKLSKIIELSLYKPPPLSSEAKQKLHAARLRANKRRLFEKKTRSYDKAERNWWTRNNEPE